MADFLKSLKVKGVEIDTSGATSGQVFQYNGTKFLPTAPSGGATISDTPPVSPTAGQFWFESDTGKTFVYYDSVWVEVSGGGGFRSGVVTSSTRPTNPFEGQIIYETDTNRVLVYDNTAWVMIADTDSPPAMQLVKTQTVGTGVSSVIVSNVFSADYENYLVTLSGGTISSANLDIALQLRAGSTTSTTDYYSSLVYVFGGTVYSFNLDNSLHWLNAGGGAGTDARMRIEISGPFLTQPTGYFASTPRHDIRGTSSGYHNVATSYDSLVITPNASTITGGTIRVYGYRNTI